MSHWTILCDFDGTVSVEDITDSLLERFARPGWQKIEQAWRRGEIGSHDCMAEQVALLDASREEIDAHLDSMMIDRAFAAFVAEVEAAGIELAVVSDGLDYAIRRILVSHGLGVVRETCDQIVSIPMSSAVESLNAGVAAGVTLYEIDRQRAAAR